MSLSLCVRCTFDWAENNIPDLYCDSYMIEYLMQYCGLISFDVSKGLVSNEEMSGDKLFNTYVHTLYKEKALEKKHTTNPTEKQ